MPAITFISARRIVLLLMLSFFIGYSQGQPAEQLIKVVEVPDHTDWTYKTAGLSLAISNNKGKH